MKISAIRDVLNATVIEGREYLDSTVEHVYASDLMSDVLAFGQSNSILLTGLASQQALITAHMAEFKGIILVRGKKPTDGSAELARNSQLVLMSTDLDMYDTCVRIDSLVHPENGVSVSLEPAVRPDSALLSQEFVVEGSDFTNSGMVSTQVKSLLKTIGLDPQLIRRVAICTFEGEMNVVMHAERARVRLSVTPSEVEVVIDDEGKGIPDVDQAMVEGFTTATEEMRARGFGSGMGLPNIKRNSDHLDVASEVGRGTRLNVRFLI